MTDVQTRPTRSRKKVILTVVAVVLVIGVAAGLALFQPWKIFTRNTVDEALPGAAGTGAVATVTAPALTTAPAISSTAAAATPEQAAAETSVAPGPANGPAGDPAGPPESAAADPEPVVTVAAVEPEPEPVSSEPVVLASGSFVDGEHATSGTALILQLPDGSRFVRLEGFSTSDGPDVDVALTDQSAGGEWGKYDDGRYLSLGDLKGTDGNQNYPIPADVDLTGLTSVVIWCDRFNVAFGSAAVSL